MAELSLEDLEKAYSKGAIPESTIKLAREKLAPAPDPEPGVDFGAASRAAPSFSGEMVGGARRAENADIAQAQNDIQQQVEAAPIAPASPQAQQVALQSAPAPQLAIDNRQMQPAPQNQSVDYLGMVGGPYNQMEAATKEFYNVGAKKAAETAGFVHQAQLENQKAMDYERDKQASENDYLQNKLTDIDNMKIDRDRLWANKSTGDKVLTGIGMFLGAFNAGGKEGNKAAKIFRDAVNDDVKLQESGIDKANNSYKQALSITKDARAARAAATLAGLNNIQMQIQEVAARYQAPEMKAKAAMEIARIEAEKQGVQMNLLSLLQKNAQTQSADPVMQQVLNLPPELKTKAIDELGKAQEWNNLTSDVTNTYQKAMGFGASAKIPSFFGGSKDEYEAWKAKMSGAIVGKVPGIKSDSDFENIVLPMLPRPSESMKTAQIKLENFKGFLRAQAPATPILKSYNLLPKTLEEKFNFTPNSGATNVKMSK